MSYILDALKKSQQERDEISPRNEYSSFSSDTAQPVNQYWLYALLLMALTMIGLLAWNLLGGVVDSGVVESGIAESEGDDGFSSRQHYAVVMPKAVTLAEQKTTVVQEQSLPATVSSVPPGSEHEPVPQRTTPPLDLLRSIPQLMINSHIYSPVADKRSVVINNRNYQEGDWIAEGVTLKEITADGLLLDVGGWPLHVGRSKGWQAIP